MPLSACCFKFNFVTDTVALSMREKYDGFVSLSLSVSSVLFTKHLLFLPLFEGEFRYRLQDWEKELWGVGF